MSEGAVPPGDGGEELIGRRDLLQRGLRTAAAAAAGPGLAAAIAGCGSGSGKTNSPHGKAAPAQQARRSNRPNILVVMVDQLRTPVWPRTVPLASELPNIARIRDGGVSFARHYTAANDCSPARSTLLTGLYTHQTGCLITGGSTLDPGFPTWGSMLRRHGYETFWYGKWHLTRRDGKWHSPTPDGPLERYGFSGGTYPSPNGGPGQGMRADPGIAAQFERWLTAQDGRGPWCTTVSFVNPHDIAWWYRFTERVRSEARPPSVSRELAPNFETPEQLVARNKPSLQRSLQDTAAESFGAVPFHGREALEEWLPFMDLYVHLQHTVDRQIGRVLDALHSRPDVAAETIVVFTSDHGEYASSHGMRGKGASAYEEAVRVPLIVKDPTGALTAAPAAERRGLTSSVDVAPLLLTIARGSDAWREEPAYAHLASRHDIGAMLADPASPGRRFVMHATDETVTEFAAERYAFQAPRHVIALRTEHAKAVSYSHWGRGTLQILPTAQEHETYDYASEAGRLEVDNVAGDGTLDEALKARLAESIRTELRRPLPRALHAAQRRGLADYHDTAEANALAAAASRAARLAKVPKPRARKRKP